MVRFPTVLFLFGQSFASDPDHLSLLQVQVQRHSDTTQCPTTTEHDCHATGDTHVHSTRAGNFDMQTPGIMPMVTHCNGDHIQFYQCFWSSHVGRISGVRGYAAKFGNTTVRVVSTSGQKARVCIDSLDGCQAAEHYVGHHGLKELDVMVQLYQTGVRISRPSTAWRVWHRQNAINNQDSWMDAYISAPNSVRSDSSNDVCIGGKNYPSIDWQFVDNPNTANFEGSLFTAEDLKGWCDTCRWQSAEQCQKPLPVPEPPTPEEECNNKNLSYAKALECCEPVEGDPVLNKQCRYDYCVEGDDKVCTAYELAEGSEGRPICLTEKASDECPQPTSEVCANSAKLDLTNVIQNNMHEAGGRLVYGNAGTINGKDVDLVVTAEPGYTPYMGAGGNEHSGTSGEFGVINVACGTEAELTFTIVQSGTNTPEPIQTATLSYYDLDEGKRGKGRMTVETCDQDETVLAENTELTQVVTGKCVAVTSSKKGNAQDNPTSLMELDDIQRARAVTYTFSNLSTWKSSVSLAQGVGGRGFMFSLRPAQACRPGTNLAALGWVPAKPGEKVVPEDRRNCTVGGCPWGKGCCMDKSWWLGQSWARPNRRIRDSCLAIGFNWCTMGNKQQTKESLYGDKPLAFAVNPPMTFLLEVGMFSPEVEGMSGERERLLKPVRKAAGEEDIVEPNLFPELSRFEKRAKTCISGRVGAYLKCTSGTWRDASCQQQAAVACVAKKACKGFAFLTKSQGKFALGKKMGKKSNGCQGWESSGD